MLKTSFITILLCISVFVTGQSKSNYSAMILSLKGKGVLMRDGKELDLEMLQRFSPGEQLKVENGQATVMLFSGEEVVVAAVSDYTIPENKNATASNVSEMANRAEGEMSLINQSGSASRIRGEGQVFPLKSKINHPKNAILRLHYVQVDSLSMSFVLKDSKTQKVVFEINEVKDTIIDLSQVSFVEGISYYWIMSNTPQGRPANGTIVYKKTKSCDSVFNVSDSHYDNLNHIFELYNKQYFFDAYETINTCIKKYPHQEIYKVLLSNTLKH